MSVETAGAMYSQVKKRLKSVGKGPAVSCCGYEHLKAYGTPVLGWKPILGLVLPHISVSWMGRYPKQ